MNHRRRRLPGSKQKLNEARLFVKRITARLRELRKEQRARLDELHDHFERLWICAHYHDAGEDIEQWQRTFSRAYNELLLLCLRTNRFLKPCVQRLTEPSMN